MLFKDLPGIYILLKQKTKTNLFINLNNVNILYLSTSKAIEDVLLNNYDSFKKDGGFKRLRYILGEGLLTGEEPKHLNNKKEISKAFSNEKIKEYEYKVSEVVDSIISGWSGKVNVKEEMQFLVFKSVMEIFFSENADTDFIEIKNNIAIGSDKVSNNINDEELENSIKKLREISKKIVDKRLNSKENKNDFLDQLINSYNNKKISIDDVYDEAITILLSSYETTACVLEWAIYYLAANKEWQENIFQNKNVDAFIHEVLRLCPPVWTTERVATKNVEIDGTEVVAGTKVVISSLAMHRDENIFKNPELFNPKKWTENKTLSKGEYFPFLFGKRQCIGKDFAWMEITVVLTKIAKKFIIETEDHDISSIAGLTYRKKNDTIIHVVNR